MTAGLIILASCCCVQELFMLLHFILLSAHTVVKSDDTVNQAVETKS